MIRFLGLSLLLILTGCASDVNMFGTAYRTPGPPNIGAAVGQVLNGK